MNYDDAHAIQKDAKQVQSFKNDNRFIKNLTSKFSHKNEPNNFLFEIILLRSILYYKYEKGLIEINVELKNENNEDNFYYIYYEMEILDLLILEMIESQIKFDLRINNFCNI